MRTAFESGFLPRAARLSGLRPLSTARAALAGLVVCLAAQALPTLTGAAEPDPIPGHVFGPSGLPAPGARIRIQGSEDFFLAGPDGSFLLPRSSVAVRVTGGLEGYRIGWAILPPAAPSVRIDLVKLPEADHPEYVWQQPSKCRECHIQIYQDWSASPHARAAKDPIVLALYRGTNYDGSPSPGFGYRKAHPNSYGDCAFCHAPGFAAHSADPGDDLDPFHDLDRIASDALAPEANGVFCDFCHKVRAVTPSSEPPRRGTKLHLLRPPPSEPLMFGQFDDVTFPEMGAAYSPLHGQTSDLCSLCHWDANRHGVPIGSTYAEWLASPYPAQGKLCQGCHMAPSGREETFCFWEPVTRNPNRIYSHKFLGADAVHLDRALTLEAAGAIEEAPGGAGLTVDVSVTNTGAGHSVPTGVSLRQVLLVVEARRRDGSLLDLASGPRLPAWAGEAESVEVGPVEAGYFAGLPGRGFAKIVTDGAMERVFDSEATAIASDNRIAPQATDRSQYLFTLASPTERVRLRVRLIHRRWWRDLRDERGFPGGDTLMAERIIDLPAGAGDFRRGDADENGALEITDAVLTLGFLFQGAPTSLDCPDAADADDSGALDLTDPIAVLNYLFLAGPAPPAPFPEPGPDPTGDPFDC